MSAAALLPRACRLQQIDLQQMEALRPAFTQLPLPQAQQRGCVLLHAHPGDGNSATFIAVVSAPFDAALSQFIASTTLAPTQMRLALASDIETYLTRREAEMQTMDARVFGDATRLSLPRGEMESLSLASIQEAATPAVHVVNSTLYDALRLGASDIHIETTPGGLATKFRIDGVLEPMAQVAGTQLAEQVVSRIKVLAELDIAERRVPQDGSFRVEAQGREIDLRVSIMPSVHGEDAVIRILDKKALLDPTQSLSLDLLGFGDSTLASLRRLARLPYGMLLVTGPTGSGKTTTLYGALSEINDGREKIITIEDPVEYQLSGVLQIPVNTKKGLSFAKGLRSILRHDPDKIMVGEIRDRETAEIAIQSALTGHLVMSTVHANSVYDVFGRFQHMGVDVYSFVSALNGVSAQRLMRLNCRHCSRPQRPGDTALAALGLTRVATEGWNFMQGAGCGECRGSGYRGRKAVAEVLAMSPELAEKVVARQSMRQIIDCARQAGTVSLLNDALRLVAQGETSLDEVARVTLA